MHSHQPNTEPIDPPPHDVEDQLPEHVFVAVPLEDLNLNTSQFDSVPHAFMAFLKGSVGNAMTKTYDPPVNFLRAFANAFCEDNHFSLWNTAIIGTSVVLGCTAAAFSVKPSSQAVPILSQLITNNPAFKFSAESTITIIAQTINTGRTVIVGTFSALKMLNYYLGKKNPAVKYLSVVHLSKKEQQSVTWYSSLWKPVSAVGKQAFIGSNALAADVAVFAASYTPGAGGICFAVAIAAANLGFYWMGMNNWRVLESHHFAHEAELHYLHKSVADFIKFPRAKQLAVLNELKMIEESNAPDKYKKLYARILNLAKPADMEVFQTQEYHPVPTREKAIAMLSGICGGIAQATFVEASGIDTYRLLKHTPEAVSMTMGLLAALLSLLPVLGFGFMGSYDTAKRVMSHEKALAELNHPEIRTALQYLLNFFNVLAAGTIIDFAYNTANDFTSVTNIKGTLERILKLSTIGFCATASSITIISYLLTVLDELLVFLAVNCGDDDIRKLFTFVLEARKLEAVLAMMPERNYLELLLWKMEFPHHATQGDRELSELMHRIFAFQLDGPQYTCLQKQLREMVEEKNKERQPGDQMNPNVVQPQENYSSFKPVPSFLAKQEEEFNRLHPGLRRRRGCCLFSSSGQDEAHAIEMGELPGKNPI